MDEHVAEEPFRLLASSRIVAWIDVRLSWVPVEPAARQGVRISLYFFVTWVAPMILASIAPPRLGAISFMADFETHLRSLVAIPLLLFAESQVDPEVRYVVHSFASPRRCRKPEELEARVRVLQPLLAHPSAGIVLLAVAFLFVPPWLQQHVSGRETWIFEVRSGHRTLTTAGIWEAYVVVPLYMFLLLRWMWRWVVLTVVFARCAPLLRPVVSHGDRCGGFSFVSYAPARFAWVIAGASSLVSARWLFEIVRGGLPAEVVTKQMVAVPILSVLIAFFPLLGLSFHFARAKRSGLRRYRAVLEGHAKNVEREWFRRTYPARVSSDESSSLLDLNGVYDFVRTMRIVPYIRTHVVAVVLAAAIPMLPVLFSIAPVEQIIREVFQALL